MIEIGKEIDNLALTRLSQATLTLESVESVVVVSLASTTRGHGGRIGR